jgi:hypothetical protein
MKIWEVTLWKFTETMIYKKKWPPKIEKKFRLLDTQITYEISKQEVVYQTSKPGNCSKNSHHHHQILQQNNKKLWCMQWY